MGGVEWLPKRDHFEDERGHGLRTTWHPDQGLIVLSLWDGERCVGTFRLAQKDISRLTGFLVEALGDASVGPTRPNRADGNAAVNGG